MLTSPEAEHWVLVRGYSGRSLTISLVVTSVVPTLLQAVKPAEAEPN